MQSEFYRYANTRTLNQIIEVCAKSRTPEGDVLMGYAVFELLERGLKCDHPTFKAVFASFPNQRFTFSLNNLGQLA